MLPDNLSTDTPIEKSSVQVEHFLDIDNTPDNNDAAVQDASIIDDPPIIVDSSIAEHSSPVVQCWHSLAYRITPQMHRDRL